MGEAAETFDRAHKHLLYDKNSGNTWLVAIPVSLGKLGPILWLSFLHLYHVKQLRASPHDSNNRPFLCTSKTIQVPGQESKIPAWTKNYKHANHFGK